jgi:hypothetical protein
MKTRFNNFINESVKTKEIEKSFIDAWQPLFDAHPNLKAVPVYAWGRYYKYECAGGAFEVYIDKYGFSKFRHMRIPSNLDWDLLKELDKLYNIPGGKIWVGEYGDYSPDREDIVKAYRFDDRAGKCLVIEKDENGNLEVICYNCDSPE